MLLTLGLDKPEASSLSLKLSHFGHLDRTKFSEPRQMRSVALFSSKLPEAEV